MLKRTVEPFILAALNFWCLYWLN